MEILVIFIVSYFIFKYIKKLKKEIKNLEEEETQYLEISLRLEETIEKQNKIINLKNKWYEPV